MTLSERVSGIRVYMASTTTTLDTIRNRCQALLPLLPEARDDETVSLNPLKLLRIEFIFLF